MAGLLIYQIYLSQSEVEMMRVYGLVAAGGAIITVALFQKMKLYSIRALQSFARSSGKAVLALGLVVVILTALAFFFKAGLDFSRLSLVLWFAASTGYLVISRIIGALLVRKWTRDGRLIRRAVIVGGGPRAEKLIDALEKSQDTGIEIVGVFDDRDDGRSPGEVGRYHKLGNIDELVEFVRETRIDLLIVTLPLSAETRLLQMLKKLWILPVDIRLSAHSTKLRFQPSAYSYIGDVPFFDMFDRPLKGWDSVIKEIEDRVLGTILLILSAPIMALVAIAIKLDSKGPVFFKQKRYGFNNEMIGVYKFRSMYTDMTDADAARLATRDDPRITRVGRFIRKTSLDELPQFLNVVKGELAIVGPRPHAVLASAANHLYVDVVEGYFARHRVKPGITGWAQINGWRGETDTKEKIQRRTECDLYYIENWSVLLDLYIIALTPFALFNTENAY
ncbi:MAG TPA: undecaprenyl-phosphate glucose phosphotransferase [Rhizobiales bacterium]|nr:undecaprenyl-phosphate glucose phosphotransferase [Hyphomicrobiales bacterium]